MGIFSRLSDIINSNINSLLDSAEDPQKMIRLIIQEMEETLVEVRSDCARIIADQKTLQRKLARHQQEATDWEAKAKLALSKQREDLARAALAEKADCEHSALELEAEYTAMGEHLDALNTDIAQLQSKLDEAKGQQKQLLLRAKTAENRIKLRTQLHKQDSADAVNKFERFQRKLDNLEGEVEAFDMGKDDLAKEIDQLAQNDQIDAELARLKEAMSK